MISRQTVEHSIGLAILAVIAVGAFFVLRPFLSAIIWGAVLAFSTWPLFERLKGALGGRDSLAAAVMILAIFCVLLVPIAVLAWSMADEVVRLFAIVRGWFETGIPSLPHWV